MNAHAERESRSSDPLPYVQVDRAVRLNAAPRLATILGVSNQHMVGSLVEFWELCGAPRELERIVTSTPADRAPCVVLPTEVVARRFYLASGKRAEVELLAEVGLLEEAEGGHWRVRGMSRYFAPIRRRLQARAAAKNGGMRSAARRAEKYGSAQPQRSEAASAVARPTTEAAPKRPRSDSRTDDRSGAELSGQRTTTTSLSYESDVGAGAPRSTPPGPEVELVDDQTPPDVADGAQGFWVAFQAMRAEQLGAVREKATHPRALGTWWSHALMETGGDERRLWRAAQLYVADKHWRSQGAPWSGFAGPRGQWEQFATRAALKPEANPHVYSEGLTLTPAGKCSVCDLELYDGDRGERCPGGPRGLPLCIAHNAELIEAHGSNVWADGFGQSAEAAAWLATARGATT